MRHLANGHTVAQINPKKGFRIHLLVFALTIPAIWLIWFLQTEIIYGPYGKQQRGEQVYCFII